MECVHVIITGSLGVECLHVILQVVLVCSVCM